MDESCDLVVEALDLARGDAVFEKGGDQSYPNLNPGLKRVRYFTDGAVIGSKAFAGARERFTVKAGRRAAAAGTLWSMRDLRVRLL